MNECESYSIDMTECMKEGNHLGYIWEDQISTDSET